MNLKLKPTKVQLFQRGIKFLGHQISEGGVAMDEGKVTKITQWPAPKNVHETRTSLGLCGSYRRYVKDLVAHAAPLHELTKRDTISLEYRTTGSV